MRVLSKNGEIAQSPNLDIGIEITRSTYRTYNDRLVTPDVRNTIVDEVMTRIVFRSPTGHPWEGNRAGWNKTI